MDYRKMVLKINDDIYENQEKKMWLYWCLLSTIISGFIPIALKKCSNN